MLNILGRIPQRIAPRTINDHSAVLHILSPILMLQTGIYRFRGPTREGVTKGATGYNTPILRRTRLTSCILRSLPTKRSTAAAYNLVYEDYIPRSIQSLVAFLPVVPAFSMAS